MKKYFIVLIALILIPQVSLAAIPTPRGTYLFKLSATDGSDLAAAQHGDDNMITAKRIAYSNVDGEFLYAIALTGIDSFGSTAPTASSIIKYEWDGLNLTEIASVELPDSLRAMDIAVDGDGNVIVGATDTAGSQGMRLLQYTPDLGTLDPDDIVVTTTTQVARMCMTGDSIATISDISNDATPLVTTALSKVQAPAAPPAAAEGSSVTDRDVAVYRQRWFPKVPLPITSKAISDSEIEYTFDTRLADDSSVDNDASGFYLYDNTGKLIGDSGISVVPHIKTFSLIEKGLKPNTYISGRRVSGFNGAGEGSWSSEFPPIYTLPRTPGIKTIDIVVRTQAGEIIKR